MAELNVMGRLDNAIGDFFAQWNVASTVIAGLLVVVFLYPIFVSKDPDTHPFLLARQAQASPIRQQGESAVYRSTEIPYGYALRSGLAIKDPGASKWTTGRDGDLRDVWRQAINGPTKEDGSSSAGTAKIVTTLGIEKIVEHDLKALTVDINVIGKYIKEAGGRRVAICLSNSTELLSTIFAGSFYSFSPILIPYYQNHDITRHLLGTTDYDTLIAEAGSLALEAILSKNKSIRRVIWVAKSGSKHLDWNEVPEGVGGKIDVTTWHDLIEEKKASALNEVPALDKENEPPSVYAFWPTKTGKHEIIEYTQKNLVAGTAAIYSSMPRLHRLEPSDSVLLTAPLSTSYGLCFSLVSLFIGATLILTSVSGPGINLVNATTSARQKLKPTHIIADAGAIPRLVEDVAAMAANGRLRATFSMWSTNRAVAQGYMPEASAKPGYLPSSWKALKTIYIAQPDFVDAEKRIESSTVAQLRLLLTARISVALTAGRVAGFVAQSNILDYRDKGKICCVGPVAASLELHLIGDEIEMGKSEGVGKITVKGPSAVGKEKEKVVLENVAARIDADNTVILV